MREGQSRIALRSIRATGLLQGCNNPAMGDTALIFPALGALYDMLAPWAEALLRAIVGLALVPHGLRMAFGLFPGTGGPIRDLKMMAQALDRWGYPPGKLWAPLIAATQLLAGPLLALGLFTRIAAVPIVIFLLVSNVERWRVGGYFWNTQGLEYTLMWTAGAFYFLVHGGGAISLDRLIGHAL
jgi:putative oxidoreductase